MILQGKNLIISANGSVIAAAKSCTLNVDCEKIKVSSPTDGQWEHIIAGMKSWSLSTNHLLESVSGYAYKVTAFAQASDGITTPRASFIRGNNGILQTTSRGITAFTISPDGGVSLYNTFDTYSSQTAVNELVSFISNISTVDMCALVSYDAIGMTDNLKAAIANKFHVDMSQVPNGNYRCALIVIGNKEDINDTPGIVMFKKDNDGFGGSVHAELLFDNNYRPITATPLKNCVARVGQLFTISVQVDGFGSDRLSGTALCNTFQVTATRGNLMQGSFKFAGSGPLQ